MISSRAANLLDANIIGCVCNYKALTEGVLLMHASVLTGNLTDITSIESTQKVLACYIGTG